MPAAAKRASMPPPGGGIIGVSGGGGEPRCARTVEVEAVELRRFTPPGLGILSTGSDCLDDEAPDAPTFGGGQYCWWYSGKGFTAGSLPLRWGAFWKRPSLSGVSGPGDSGRGLGAVPLRSASLEGCIDPSAFRAPYPPTVGLFGSLASNRARLSGEVGLGPVALEPRRRPSVSGGVAFLVARSRSLRGVYLPEPSVGCFGGRSSGYGSGAVGGAVGGAGNEGIGGGRENAGWFELPAESVRGGGLMPSRPFCIRNGPTVGVSGLSGRKKSSSSARPCFLPSMVESGDYVYRLQVRLLDRQR